MRITADSEPGHSRRPGAAPARGRSLARARCRRARRRVASVSAWRSASALVDATPATVRPFLLEQARGRPRGTDRLSSTIRQRNRHCHQRRSYCVLARITASRNPGVCATGERGPPVVELWIAPRAVWRWPQTCGSRGRECGHTCGTGISGGLRRIAGQQARCLSSSWPGSSSSSSCPLRPPHLPRRRRRASHEPGRAASPRRPTRSAGSSRPCWCYPTRGPGTSSGIWTRAVCSSVRSDQRAAWSTSGNSTRNDVPAPGGLVRCIVPRSPRRGPSGRAVPSPRPGPRHHARRREPPHEGRRRQRPARRRQPGYPAYLAAFVNDSETT